MTENAATETTDPTMPEAFHAFVERIEALDDDQLNLLGLTAIETQDALLTRVQEADTLDEAKRLAGLAGTMMSLTGLSMGTARERSGWTSTGDRKVAGIMSDFRDFVTGGAMTVLKDADLPEDLMQRLATGQGTEEDIAHVKSILAGRTGKDPEDFEMSVHVIDSDGNPVKQAPGAGEPVETGYVAPKRDTLYL